MQSHWNGYLNALGAQRPPKTTIDLGSFTQTPQTTGFQPIAVINKDAQKKYDAMSSSWMGVEASEKAAQKGVFKTSFMPTHNNNG
jgi:hypothetical protein